MRLTDRNFATGVTKQDLIHIVITGDTTDSPEGSSYKAPVGQILELFNLPVPLVKLQTLPLGVGSNVVTLNANNTVGSNVKLINPPKIIVQDLSLEQINHGVFIEMVQYKMKGGSGLQNNSKGGGYIVQPLMEDDGLGNIINGLQNRIMTYYGKTINNRGGIQTKYDSGSPGSTTPLIVPRMNHYQVIGINEVVPLDSYFEGRFIYRTEGYVSGATSPFSGILNNVPVPYTNAQKNVGRKKKSGILGLPYQMCYGGSLTSLYVSFRYLMFDPYSNEGKGKFIEGPLSKTIKVTNKFFPFLKTPTDGICTVNPVFTASTNNTLIRFSFVNKS
jgi:hypothetical protein